MTVIEGITPTFMVIAILAPIITGYRREPLGASIRIGWLLIVLAYFAADFLVPELVEQLYGRKAGRSITLTNNGTLAALLFGWVLALILHFAGFILRELSATIHELLSKFRQS